MSRRWPIGDASHHDITLDVFVGNAPHSQAAEIGNYREGRGYSPMFIPVRGNEPGGTFEAR